MKTFWLALFVAMCFLSCKKEVSPIKLPADDSLSIGNNLPSNAGLTPVTVTINQNQAGGFKIPAIFEGLSYETNLLNRSPSFLNENNKVLVQLIKNLGPGLLRIGGNQSDLTGWAGTARQKEQEPNSRDSLVTSDIDRLYLA